MNLEEKAQEAADEEEFNRRSEEFWGKTVLLRSQSEPLTRHCKECAKHDRCRHDVGICDIGQGYHSDQLHD